MSHAKKILFVAGLSLIASSHHSLYLEKKAGAGEQASSITSNTSGVDRKSQSDEQKTQSIEVIQLRLEKILAEQTQSTKREMEASILGVLKEHREYLQTLDDKFYERFSFWMPVFTTAIGVIMAGLFLWYFGKTRKEAFDSAKSEASTIATEIARRKVDEIVIPEDLKIQIQNATQTMKEKIATYTTSLREDAERQLREAKDQIVSDKFEVISKTLDQAVKEKFSKQLDILARVEQLENLVSKLAGDLDRTNKRLDSVWNPPPAWQLHAKWRSLF